MKSRKPRTRAEEKAWEAVDRALLGPGTRQEQADRFFAMLEHQLGPVHKEATLGEELKRRRQELKLTPVKAAGMVSVPAARWRAWEANRGVPTHQELAGVARVMGSDGLTVLWSKAPRIVLGQVLDARPQRRVARTSGEQAPVSRQEHWRLAVVNLEPVVREGLERFVRSQGQEPTEESLAALLEQVSTWSWFERDRWIREVLAP